jgi:hypothetical protein
MARRFVWISFASVLAVAAISQPWDGGAAQAGPGPKPAAVTPCKDEVAQLKADLEASRAEVARLQAQLDKVSTAERTRQKRLQDQLGAPMIEKLH